MKPNPKYDALQMATSTTVNSCTRTSTENCNKSARVGFACSAVQTADVELQFEFGAGAGRHNNGQTLYY